MARLKRVTKPSVVDVFQSDKMTKSDLAKHLTALGSSSTPEQRLSAIRQVCTDFGIPTDQLDKKSEYKLNTIGNVCILLTRGHDLSDLYEQETIKKRLESLLLNTPAKGTSDTTPKPAKVRTISVALTNWLNTLDSLLDEFIENLEQNSLSVPPIQNIDKFDLTYLKTQELPSWQKELTRLSDEELLEGYSNFSNRRLKILKKFYESLIQQVIIEPTVKVTKSRVPRKSTKLKPAEKQLENLLCNEEKSKVKKKDILTSSELWVYNERYNTLIHFITEDGKQFEIKGSTLQNVNMDKSTQKRVKQKSEATIQDEISKSNKTRCLVVFNSITSKESTPTPRLTTDTILLKVF